MRLVLKQKSKYLKSPIVHSRIPTKSDNNIASSVYNSVDESTLPKTFETSSEVNATGPTASWRDEPNIEYTNTGTNPVSEMKNKQKHDS